MRLGSIVLVPFPYSDLTAQKRRPALIISNDQLSGDDFICLAVTSVSGPQSVKITSDDLLIGSLPLISFVKVGKVVSLHKSLLNEINVQISEASLKLILKKFKQFLG